MSRGLFYAYLKDSQHDEHYRYLITFVNREVADEWWRMISTFHSPYAGNVKRISPQFYVQDTLKINVAYFFTHAALQPHAKEFRERMFFTLLHDEDGRVQTIAPPIEVTDHISGRWYFIRSKADPKRHWYFRIDGPCLVCEDADCDTIHVSGENRTRFCVQVRNVGYAGRGLHSPKNFVMIGGDEISIAASKDYILRINDTEDLKATKMFQSAHSDLLFDDLRDRFATRTENEEADGIRKSWEFVVPVERGLGEVWELSD